MSTQLFGVLLIGLCAFISLLEGFISARKALKQNDTVMAVFAFVFLICGMVLMICLNTLTV